ncbi:MAG: TetR/AcrR family transcriptional regulator [Spirochaetales bacterium]
MPKIIPDLAPRILETAGHHFEAKGYEGTDMKSLAAELGISVGALYNYHPSKPELFMAVAARWKIDLTERLLRELDSSTDATLRLRTTLRMLYENMETFTGIWREFLSSGARFAPESPQAQVFRRDNEELNSRLQALFREVWRGHPNAAALVDDPQDRLAQIITGSIMQLVMNGQDDQAGTRAFVERWIDFLAPVST